MSEEYGRAESLPRDITVTFRHIQQSENTRWFHVVPSGQIQTLEVNEVELEAIRRIHRVTLELLTIEFATNNRTPRAPGAPEVY